MPLMLAACIARAKTQTRRVLMPYPKGEDEQLRWKLTSTTPEIQRSDFADDRAWAAEVAKAVEVKVGNIVPVVERARRIEHEGETCVQYAHDGEVFKALPLAGNPDHFAHLPLKWRCGRYLPRWACRFRLKITSVMVQRIRDINETDAGAEGMQYWLKQADHETLHRFEVGQPDYRSPLLIAANGFVFDHANRNPKPMKVDGQIRQVRLCWSRKTAALHSGKRPELTIENPWVVAYGFEFIRRGSPVTIMEPAHATA